MSLSDNSVLTPDLESALNFLGLLRPGGPWVLVAIEPDGPTTTVTARNDDEVCEFINAHNAVKNIYYSVNPTKTAVAKKPSKADIDAGEFVHADLDPRDGETPEAAKVRYLAQLEVCGPKPTAVIDSGNGIQALYRLEVALGPKRFGDIEACSKALTLRLGSKAGTQNIDRILRLPGTINHPNAAKRRAGRAPVQSKLLWFNGERFPLDAFSVEEPERPGAPSDGGQHAQQDDDEDRLELVIREGMAAGYPSRSEAEFYVINEMLRRGYGREAILKVLLDRNNRVSDKAYDEKSPHEYASSQIDAATKKIMFAVNHEGKPYNNQTNICVGLLKMRVRLRYDAFADRILIDGLPGFGPALDDAAMNRLRLTMERRFRLLPAKEMFRDVLADVARLNSFHPVRDYLDGLRWDGMQRLDKWLTTYGGAEDTPYTSAVGALLLTAAVRRVRQPGCKFDEMGVLENPDQGSNKSTAIQRLAVNESWFTDDLPLNLSGKEVIETLRGRWIIEAAELSGMRKAEVERLKAFLSRQVDRARLAYAHVPTEARRQCIIIGTTNHESYLKDTTGNRRFWPVRVKQFDVEGLTRDRDQLWAEAAARESAGAIIRLAPSLWPAAAEQQAERMIADPFYEQLQNALGHYDAGKIASESVWAILDLRGGQRTQEHNARMGKAMRDLGWERANTAGTVSIDGRNVKGYVKGDWKNDPEGGRTVNVIRDKDGLFVHREGDEPPPQKSDTRNEEIPF